MNFTGAAKKLDDIDLPTIGAQIDVGEDEIHAFLDVETRGGGFDSKGRPKMLFEPHVFYRELKDPAQRDKAVRSGVAYKRWGAQKYPKDSYPRLKNAIRINKVAALRSCSWGLGQVMGFNHKLAGYYNVEAMVVKFLEDEEYHLQAAIDFIISTGLDDELRRHDWAGFAKGYNGSQYAKHGYHLKLAAAFKKWQGIRDTPFDGVEQPREPFVVDRVAEPLEHTVAPPVNAVGDFLMVLWQRLIEFIIRRLKK